MDRCPCCGGELHTGGCSRCSSHVVMCAGCGTMLSCGCGRRASEHRCRAIVPATVTVTIPEGSVTFDGGVIQLYPACPV
jgi:hypothetical protein